jgi:ornithine decarboxylase
MTLLVRTEGTTGPENASDADLLTRLHRIDAHGPVQVIRRSRITGDTVAFRRGFEGRVLYAVKANPHMAVLRAIVCAGVEDFDIASIAELHLLRAAIPGARAHFMNPVKSRVEIRQACKAGVRSFALDCTEELHKIVEETAGIDDLGLFVRMRVDQQGAVHGLGTKFGVAPLHAVELLRQARAHCVRLGIAFHVGSQCMDPARFERALAQVGELMDASDVVPDIIDIGGGFPVPYANLDPAPLESYFAVIRSGWKVLGVHRDCELWAEPGRALCAAGCSMVLRVVLRRGMDLFLNDGVYGAFTHCVSSEFCYPVRRIGMVGAGPEELGAFTLYGPTCDGADRFFGRHLLPLDTHEGDFIEFAQLGAYGCSLASSFNGFGHHCTLELD